MNIGKLLYRLYFKPKGDVSKLFKTGFRRTLQLKKGQKEMILASQKLKGLTRLTEQSYNVYFLTGKKYWHQTAFCLYSLQKNSPVDIKAIIVDDGSFDEELRLQVMDQFPTATVVLKKTIDLLLDAKLPKKEFPVLRERRLSYPHLRKLTDIHVLPGEDWKLVLDSDMLFFKTPEKILSWLNNPQFLLFMEDTEESYGYPVPVLKQLSGTEIFPTNLNVGVAGMPSSKIDWHKLEYDTKYLIENFGTSYLQEQALTAIIAARDSYQLLQKEAYKVLPKIDTDVIPEVLHHYVADAKYDYFVKGWKYMLSSKAF